MSSTTYYNSQNLAGIGSVGIGTTNPQAALDVYTGTMNAATVTAVTYYGVLAGSNTIAGSTITASTTPAAAANVLTVIGSSTTGNVFQFSNSTALGTFIMTSGGRVGIGSSAPATVLDINGTFRVLGGKLATTSAGVGISSSSPGAGLDVNTSFRLGPNGSVLQNFVTGKKAVTLDGNGYYTGTVSIGTTMTGTTYTVFLSILTGLAATFSSAVSNQTTTTFDVNIFRATGSGSTTPTIYWMVVDY